MGKPVHVMVVLVWNWSFSITSESCVKCFELPQGGFSMRQDWRTFELWLVGLEKESDCKVTDYGIYGQCVLFWFDGHAEKHVVPVNEVKGEVIWGTMSKALPLCLHWTRCRCDVRGAVPWHREDHRWEKKVCLTPSSLKWTQEGTSHARSLSGFEPVSRRDSAGNGEFI